MADQSITCPFCGKQVPLTAALRADIEASVKGEYEQKLAEDVRRAGEEATRKAQEKASQQFAALNEQLEEQARALEDARNQELALRRRERELEREKANLELTVARTLEEERAKLVDDAKKQFADEHQLKDAEKERQLTDLRRQIEDLKRKAEQGSQQAQGEAGEEALEGTLRANFPFDDISGIGQGVRGGDIHQIVFDQRGTRCGAIVWECKNTKAFSDGWIPKLKDDQRLLQADIAVIVTAAMPKGCRRFTIMDGVIVTDFTCAAALAGLLRTQLIGLTQARSAAQTKDEKLELLYRYLTGVQFRQRVEAVVDAFEQMKAELDQERRAAERQWARRAKQIEAVTMNVAGMYGDLQGMVALPPISALELPAAQEAEATEPG